MKINPNLSGMGNLLALVNAANPGKAFTALQVSVTSVIARTPDATPYNSAAVLTGTPDGPYKHDQTVYFDRRSVIDAVDAPAVSYIVTSETTVNDLLTVVCSALKIIQTEVELVDMTTAMGSTVSTMTLRPTLNSKLYNDILTIQLTWSGDDVAESVAALWAGDQLDKLINITMPSRGYL